MNGRILVIEDNTALNKLICLVLESRYSVKGVRSATQAMKSLVQDSRPDLILLDYMLPDINGGEFLRNLKLNGLFTDIPVLFLSAENSQLLINEVFQNGADGFIQKPFNPDVLIQKVEDTISSNKYHLSA